MSSFFKNLHIENLLLLIIIIMLSFIAYTSYYWQNSSQHGGKKALTLFVSPYGNDSNDGSKARPLATIQKAANIARPGTTIHVHRGTYTSPLITYASGTSAARITYISDTMWGARIKTKDVEVSWDNRGDYVDIIGFDVTGDGAYGIFNRSSYVKMIGNHVHNIPAKLCNSNGGGGITDGPLYGNYNGHDNYIIGNVVHDIGTDNCQLVHGIYQATPHGYIWNNISFRNSGSGIHLWHAPNSVIIANNLVFENRMGGIVIGAGDEPGGVIADNIVVSNNIVIHNYGNIPGIIEFGKVGKKNKYLNNLIFANAYSGLTLQNGNETQETITIDPEFVNYQPDGSGDYHLRSSSPAIGAGTSIGAPDTDINGIRRPHGKGFDIGPYEYISTSVHNLLHFVVN